MFVKSENIPPFRGAGGLHGHTPSLALCALGRALSAEASAKAGVERPLTSEALLCQPKLCGGWAKEVCALHQKRKARNIYEPYLFSKINLSEEESHHPPS